MAAGLAGGGSRAPARAREAAVDGPDGPRGDVPEAGRWPGRPVGPARPEGHCSSPAAVGPVPRAMCCGPGGHGHPGRTSVRQAGQTAGADVHGALGDKCSRPGRRCLAAGPFFKVMEKGPR